MKFLHRTFLAFAAVGMIIPQAYALPFRVSQLPNGGLNSCAMCHVNPGGGGVRNAFGQTVERSFLNGGNVVWGPMLASLDADGDGVTNGIELQDPYGQWSSGQPNPGSSALVTNPGISSANALRTLTVNFTGMNPHVGQRLGLRVIDKATAMETGRQTVASIGGASFNISLPAVLDGGGYWVDFYADLNGNGVYDAPPVDHAWRLDADDISGNTTLNFAHNTDFTDVQWQYALTLNLSGMAPHLSNLFEVRVVDETTAKEAGRARVEVIPNAVFALILPGLELNRSYRVDFYADLNRNGRYDGTPTDHAWRQMVTSTAGDVTLNFSHNTGFTDVQWEYLFQMNLLGMAPHVGQLFELRVVDQSNEQEIDRTTVAAIALANSSVFVPGIVRSGSYRADFYADLNGSGGYNAPPVDHAWRELFTGSTGNVVLNFEHNTAFTDIQWPALGVEPRPAAEGLPAGYALAQNYPNPFNPVTTIAFDVAQAGLVTLNVYNLLGQNVANLVNDNLNAGRYELQFDASGLASGLYMYRLDVDGFAAYKTMMLIR